MDKRLTRNALLAAIALVLPVRGETTVSLPLIEPADGLSTASLPRAALDLDSRYVLFRSSSYTVIAELPVETASGRVSEIAFELPTEFQPASPQVVVGEITFPPGAETIAEVAARALQREPTGLRSEPTIWAPGEPSTVALRFAVPPDFRGRSGSLQVRARPSGSARVSRTTTSRKVASPETRVEFSYGVEPHGWDAQAPPVRFQVGASTGNGAFRPLWERILDPARDKRDRAWRDTSISLEPFSGSEVQLEFVAESIRTDATSDAVATAGVFANPTVVDPAAPASVPWNVILISLDTLRASSVGAYGYPRPTTPEIDRRMAAEGVLLKNAVVPMPYTPASHMTMMTGLDPCEHGVASIEDVLATDQPTLAEILRANGFSTAAFTENAFLVAGGGFDRGFDVYVENRNDESIVPGLARDTFMQAEAWLASAPPEPFFLFLHTYQVHQPYDPPRGYENLLPDTVAAGSPMSNRDLYDREIRYLDDIVGKFLAELDRRGLTQRTMVILTSDHGEEFEERAGHGAGHGASVRDTAVLVPLLFRAPALLPAGRTVETMVGLIDLTPTILDLLDIPQPVPMTGRAVSPLLREKEERLPPRPVFIRMIPDISNAYGLRTEKWKRIKNRDLPGKLFDLENDPLETTSLTQSRPDVVAELDALLAQHQAWCAKRRVTRARIESSERRPAWLEENSVQDRDKAREVRRKLEALGYVEHEGLQ